MAKPTKLEMNRSVSEVLGYEVVEESSDSEAIRVRTESGERTLDILSNPADAFQALKALVEKLIWMQSTTIGWRPTSYGLSFEAKGIASLEEAIGRTCVELTKRNWNR